ncbi:MAG: PDZ domain-containing protein [Actinobacteria bacterium]|nr:PDZ domain-containing protein [Actinomycetota bacterium]
MPDRAPVRYAVDLTRRVHHLVTVRQTIPADLSGGARVVLPVWTPGSYVVRHYARHVQRISARSAAGDLVLTPDGHSAWLLPDDADGAVELELELYANELTVRTNHVDDHHALLIPAATFPFVEGARDREHHVTLQLPGGWRAWGLLPQVAGAFVAADYDHLVDSAFEAGAHDERSYEVAHVGHRLVWAGHGGRPDLDRIAADAAAIGEAAVRLFDGDLPTDAYTLLCTAWDRGTGGLEHRDGAVLQVPVHALTDPDAYRRFQSLLAHEYLHLWNVKRLTPAALTALNYERPVFTESLWVAEGWTAYYDKLVVLRAGLWDTRRYLDRLGEVVDRVLRRPGRAWQSLRQASYEAWIKHYLPDENAPNAGVSYYDHGAVVAWCLDLLLRRLRPDGDGLDDVLTLLWHRFGRSTKGYHEGDVVAAVSEVAGSDVAGFFSRHVAGRQLPPVEDLTEVVGLRLVTKDDDGPVAPDLGVDVREDDDGIVLRSVLRERPAWRAGLTGGDRLLAIDRTRVGRGELTPALLGYRPGDEVEVAVFRGPRLVTATVTLGEPLPPRVLRPVEDPSRMQRDAFERWLGQALTGV